MKLVNINAKSKVLKICKMTEENECAVKQLNR